MATLQGVYSASVVDNRDREGLARVLVRVPGVSETGIWARLATMMAGRDRGTFFVPDVGDEVLVTFEQGDQRTPYVIGSLWNGKAKPPASDASTKLIRSRSGVTLRIDDSASSLVIETATGQRITLQDDPRIVSVEDQSGNAVTLDATGVTVTASAKVTVNASTIEINAGVVSVNSGMSKFSGTVQCDTIIANSVVGSSYTPGAGNVW